MAKSRLWDRQTLHNIIHWFCVLAGSLLLGIGGFLMLLTTFQLEYSPKNGFTGGLGSGLASCWNAVADTLGRNNYTILTKYNGTNPETGLVLTILLVLMVVIAFLIYRSRHAVIPAVFAVLLAIFSVTQGLYPSLISVIIFIAGMALLLCYCNLGERIGVSSLGLTAAVTVIAVVLALIPATSQWFQRPDALSKTQNKLTQAIQELRYGQDPLGNGDMTSDKRKQQDTALTVTMTDPQPMYLRGYVGEKQSGSKWTALDNSVHYDSRALISGLQNTGFNALGQLAEAAQVAGYNTSSGSAYNSYGSSAAGGYGTTAESATAGSAISGSGLTTDGATSSSTTGSQKMTIQVDKASSKYAYIPYEITDNKLESTTDYSSSFLTTEGLTGQKEYSYNVAGNLTSKWTDVTGKLYSTDLTADLQKYSNNESHYNAFVYENYTQLTDDLIQTLAMEIGTRGNQAAGHVGYKTAIKKVQTYFNTRVMPATTAPQSKNGAEALFMNHQGRDVEYAAAATAMFRYFGIPARYVEGYLVTPQNVSSARGGKMSIPLSNEHAWTEIYIDGVGFVPFEVHPQYTSLMPQADLTKGLQSKANTNPFDQPETPMQGSGSSQDGGHTGKAFPWQKILIIAGIVLGGLLALVLLFFLVRGIHRGNKRRRAFRQADAKAAIRAMFAYATARKLPLAEAAASVGREATFSSHAMNEEQKLHMASALKRARKDKRRARRENLLHLGRKKPAKKVDEEAVFGRRPQNIGEAAVYGRKNAAPAPIAGNGSGYGQMPATGSRDRKTQVMK